MKKLLYRFDKCRIVYCIVCALFFFSNYTVAQVSTNTAKSEKFVRDCIVEVFQNHADDLVFNSDSRRFALITDFIKNRVKVTYNPEYVGKEFELLSSVGLNNKYNPNLFVDTNYNSNTFNPLKYKLPLTPKTERMYRIDNTDYIITIYPTK